jgi:PAS domain S-box-containing protein
MRAHLLHFAGLLVLGAALVALGGRGLHGAPHIDLTRGSFMAGRTLDARFTPPPELLAAGALAGLGLPAVDGGYDVYLNGRQLYTPRETGAPAARFASREIVLPLPRARLTAGENRLTLRAAGDAPAPEGVYEIGPFASLARENGAWLAAVFVSMYTLLGVFALALALAVRNAFKLTSFGLLSLTLAGYFLAHSTEAIGWAGGHGASFRLERALLYVAVALGLAFLAAMLAARGRLRRLMLGYAALAAAAAGLVWVLPLTALPAMHTGLQATGLVTLAAAALPAWRALARNPSSASLLPGLVLLAFTTGWDITADLAGSGVLRLAPYGAFLLVSSLAAGMAQQFLFLHRAAETVGAELARSEQRLGAFYNATREGVCIRRGNVVLDVNPAFELLFGVPKSRCVGAPFTGFFALESQAAVARGLDGEGPFEAVAARADGSRFDAECLNRTADPSGDSVKVTALRDITEFKRFRGELERRNAELEALNRVVVDRELYMVELKRRIRAGGAGGS